MSTYSKAGGSVRPLSRLQGQPPTPQPVTRQILPPPQIALPLIDLSDQPSTVDPSDTVSSAQPTPMLPTTLGKREAPPAMSSPPPKRVTGYAAPSLGRRINVTPPAPQKAAPAAKPKLPVPNPLKQTVAQTTAAVTTAPSVTAAVPPRTSTTAAPSPISSTVPPVLPSAAKPMPPIAASATTKQPVAKAPQQPPQKQAFPVIKPPSVQASVVVTKPSAPAAVIDLTPSTPATSDFAPTPVLKAMQQAQQKDASLPPPPATVPAQVVATAPVEPMAAPVPSAVAKPSAVTKPPPVPSPATSPAVLKASPPVAPVTHTLHQPAAASTTVPPSPAPSPSAKQLMPPPTTPSKPHSASRPSVGLQQPAAPQPSSTVKLNNNPIPRPTGAPAATPAAPKAPPAKPELKKNDLWGDLSDDDEFTPAELEAIFQATKAMDSKLPPAPETLPAHTVEALQKQLELMQKERQTLEAQLMNEKNRLQQELNDKTIRITELVAQVRSMTAPVTSARAAQQHIAEARQRETLESEKKALETERVTLLGQVKAAQQSIAALEAQLNAKTADLEQALRLAPEPRNTDNSIANTSHTKRQRVETVAKSSEDPNNASASRSSNLRLSLNLSLERRALAQKNSVVLKKLFNPRGGLLALVTVIDYQVPPPSSGNFNETPHVSAAVIERSRQLSQELGALVPRLMSENLSCVYLLPVLCKFLYTIGLPQIVENALQTLDVLVLASADCRTQLLRHAMSSAKRPFQEPPTEAASEISSAGPAKFPAGVKSLRAKRPSGAALAEAVPALANSSSASSFLTKRKSAGEESQEKLSDEGEKPLVQYLLQSLDKIESFSALQRVLSILHVLIDCASPYIRQFLDELLEPLLKPNGVIHRLLVETPPALQENLIDLLSIVLLNNRLLDVASSVAIDSVAPAAAVVGAGEGGVSGDESSVLHHLLRYLLCSSNYEMRLKVLRMLTGWCRLHPRGVPHMVEHLVPARLVKLLSQEISPKAQNLTPHIHAMEVTPHENEMLGEAPFPSAGPVPPVEDKRVQLVNEAVHLLLFLAEHVQNIYTLLCHHEVAVISFTTKLSKGRIHPQLASLAPLGTHLENLILAPPASQKH